MNTDLIEENCSKWIETIKHCVTQMTEQRRAEIKHRSSSVDQSSRSHHRRLKKHPTVPIRALYVDLLISVIRIFRVLSFSESEDELTIDKTDTKSRLVF